MMTEHELEIANNSLTEGHLFYGCGEQCLEASRELSIGLDDIEESILCLHEELRSQDFIDGDQQVFIGYAKIFACLKELKQLKSDKDFNNQTAK